MQETTTGQSALDALTTIEAYTVTLFGVLRQRGSELDLDAPVRRLLRTAQCEHEAHHSMLVAEGGIGLTATYTIDPALHASGAAVLETVSFLAELASGAWVAASRLFATEGRLPWVEVSAQAAAVESQLLALARAYAGEEIPNDRAFLRWQFQTPEEAVDVLLAQGIVEGPGEPTPFPGPLERNCRGVFGLVPETTEDQQVP